VPAGLEEVMKVVKWGAIAGIVALAVLLYVGKDDLRRMREMRQM
jgi:hypothetical protein